MEKISHYNILKFSYVISTDIVLSENEKQEGFSAVLVVLTNADTHTSNDYLCNICESKKKKHSEPKI
jgi:hypothetical protein